jgi:hypothetical protein
MLDEGHSDRLAKKDTEKGLLKFRWNGRSGADVAIASMGWISTCGARDQGPVVASFGESRSIGDYPLADGTRI